MNAEPTPLASATIATKSGREVELQECTYALRGTPIGQAGLILEHVFVVGSGSGERRYIFPIESVDYLLVEPSAIARVATPLKSF